MPASELGKVLEHQEKGIGVLGVLILGYCDFIYIIQFVKSETLVISTLCHCFDQVAQAWPSMVLSSPVTVLRGARCLILSLLS